MLTEVDDGFASGIQKVEWDAVKTMIIITHTYIHTYTYTHRLGYNDVVNFPFYRL